MNRTVQTTRELADLARKHGFDILGVSSDHVYTRAPYEGRMFGANFKLTRGGGLITVSHTAARVAPKHGEAIHDASEDCVVDGPIVDAFPKDDTGDAPIAMLYRMFDLNERTFAARTGVFLVEVSGLRGAIERETTHQVLQWLRAKTK